MTSPKAGVYAKRARIVWLVAVIIVAAAIYIPSLHGDFLLDDSELIVKNPVSQRLSSLPRAFSTYFLYGFDKTDLLYYRPLITVSYQINNALSYHDPIACKVTNLLLNVLMGAAVFLFVNALTRKTTLAGATALAFVALPCHAETVAWISGRTDMIAGLFMIAGFMAFLANYRKRPAFDWRLALLTSLMFACSLFSKEIGLMLPVLIAIYLFTLGDSIKRDEFLKWIPVFVIPIVLYIVCRRLVLGVTVDGQMGYLLKERLSRVGYLYAKYLRMLFIPREARPIYDSMRTDVVAPIIKISAWLIPAGLVAFSIWARKRLPVPAFGAAWIFAMLLPVVDILPVHGLVITERFAYLPSIGSSLILGWLFSHLIRLRPKALKTLPFGVGLLGAGFVMYCAALSISGSQAYASNLDWAKWVWTNKPKVKIMRITASSFLQDAGYRKEAAEELEAAVDLGWNSISKAHTADWKYKLGLVYVQYDDYARAARTFRGAVRLDPKRADIWLTLAKADSALGRYSDAVNAYEKANALHPLAAADLAGLAKARKNSKGL